MVSIWKFIQPIPTLLGGAQMSRIFWSNFLTLFLMFFYSKMRRDDSNNIVVKARKE
jgi:hypothetical protein